MWVHSFSREGGINSFWGTQGHRQMYNVLKMLAHQLLTELIRQLYCWTLSFGGRAFIKKKQSQILVILDAGNFYGTFLVQNVIS